MREKHFILNNKGIKLAAFVERPDTVGKFPGVVLLPGLTGYKEEAQYVELANELVTRKISSIRFDPSGFGESGGTLEFDYTFSNYSSDTEKIYNWFANQEFTDPTRTGVMGQSMGGFQALIIAGNHPEIKCVVSVSSPNTFYRKGESEAKDEKIEEWEEKGYLVRESSRFGTLKLPYDYLLDAKRYVAAEFARKIKVPKLIILGTMDANVPNSETRQIYNESVEPKELWEVEGMDHYYKRNPEMLEKVTKKCADFIEKHI